jgi:hypothetical protein
VPQVLIRFMASPRQIFLRAAGRTAPDHRDNGCLRGAGPLCWLFDYPNSKKGRSAKEAASSPHLYAAQQILDISGALLCLFLHRSCRLRRKLKHRCLLTFT